MMGKDTLKVQGWTTKLKLKVLKALKPRKA